LSRAGEDILLILLTLLLILLTPCHHAWFERRGKCIFSERKDNMMAAVFAQETQDGERILVSEPIARAGIELLRRELPEARIDERFGLHPAQLRALIGEYSALIVRSETRVTGELLAAAPRLKVIGRAGSGVDNIDLDAAMRWGVLVVYAPRGNVVAVAEHTLALLLALVRHLPEANASLKAGR